MSIDLDPPGLRLNSVAAWMSAAGIEVRGPLAAELLAGGRSNITYRLTDEAGGLWVLRRPPLGHVMPTAHDMKREYRVLRGLDSVHFPVPHPISVCDDDEVIGATFLLMDFVDGRVVDSAAAADALPLEHRAEVSRALVDCLAQLHRLDPAAAGLADLGRPDGYLQRQVARWSQQWESSATREFPPIERLRDRLAACVPASGGSAIVHGDFRIDNTLLGDDMSVRAVVDWEMATLGDPVADLAVALVYWTQADDRRRSDVPVAEAVTSGRGFWTRQQIVNRYRERTGDPLESLDFCVALAAFKLAVIMESIRKRALGGQQLGAAADAAEQMGRATESLTSLGLAALDEGAIAGLSS